LRHFILWLDAPIEQITPKKVTHYIDVLQRRRLTPNTINCHLRRIRQFYHYLSQEEHLSLTNPVKRGSALRTSKPLPRCLSEEHVTTLFRALRNKRDRAMFMLMLRSGLRVEEVAALTFNAINVERRSILIVEPKWGKDRVVYVSDDALRAFLEYLKVRPPSRAKRVFLVEKGIHRGKPLSIRGLQKRIEYYAKKTGLTVSCHTLRHTWADQMLNAGAGLETVQDLLGHSWITTTQRYCRLCNQRVRVDYFKAMEIVIERTTASALGP
jgi:site-specific recombinase XerD